MNASFTRAAANLAFFLREAGASPLTPPTVKLYFDNPRDAYNVQNALVRDAPLHEIRGMVEFPLKFVCYGIAWEIDTKPPPHQPPLDF